ncbi:MAG: LptF/LptG family permease [bacterium]|nr:LptF/LptG family permease [bacterium]
MFERLALPMSILSRYIIRQFLRPLIYALILFTGIILITEAFEMVNTFITRDIPLFIIIKYFIFKIPLYLFLVTPLSVLLATLFSLNELFKRNEITAMKSVGINLYRIILPVLCMGVLLSISSLLWNEFVAVRANCKVEEIKRRCIHKIGHGHKKAHDIHFKTSNKILEVKYFDGGNGWMEDVNIFTLKNSSPKQRLNAKRGEWKQNRWFFYEVEVRGFNERGEEREVMSFASIEANIGKSPDEIWEIIELQGMKAESLSSIKTISQLKRCIEMLKGSGCEVKDKLVELYFKVSFPFCCLIMAFFSAPLALQGFGRGRAASFGLSILIGFIYWGVMAIGRSLGKNGILPPLLSSWLGNITFFAVGIILMIKSKK